MLLPTLALATCCSLSMTLQDVLGCILKENDWSKILEFMEIGEGCSIQRSRNYSDEFTFHDFFAFCQENGIKSYFVWRSDNKTTLRSGRFNVRDTCKIVCNLWLLRIKLWATYVISCVPLSGR